MDERGYRFGVGVLVVASSVIAVILVLFFGAAPNFFAQRYLVTIRFDAAPGVTTDTPVRKNGVQIGRVKNVLLLDEDGVDLTLELDSKFKVRSGELPRIGNGSIITGDAVVEFIPPTPASLIERFDGTGGSPQNGVLDENESKLASTPIKNGDFLSGGRVAPDPLDALLNMQESMGAALTEIQGAAVQVSGLAADLRNIVGGGDGEIQKITSSIEGSIKNFNNTLNAIEAVFRNPDLNAALNTMASRLPELITDAENVMKQTEDTLAAFEGVGRAAEETMKNVTEFTEPLGKNGEAIVTEVMQTIENLNTLLADLRNVAGTVNQVAVRVNNGQGTLSKLIDDDELYYTLINTLQNVETLTRRLQPVIEDARVFTDKLARDPASLIDVRGAITGRPRGGVK